MTGTELATRDAESLKRAAMGHIPGMQVIPWMMRIEEHPSWEILAQLRVTLRAGVALNRFRVKDLLVLQVGQVLETISSSTEDVPLKVGQVQLGWSEFEVLDQRMSLRLTRLG